MKPVPWAELRGKLSFWKRLPAFFRLNFTPDRAFIGLFLFFGCIGILRVFITRGESFADVFFQVDNDTFMDYFNSVYAFYRVDSLAEVYTKLELFYPPLATLSYLLAFLIIPESHRVAAAGSIGARNDQAVMMVFFMQFLIVALVVALLLVRMSKGGTFRKYATVLLLFCSTPMLYLLERGNIIFPTLAFTLLFFYWKDSDKAWKREAALIALAVAAGLKIYPALFGVLLLNRKQWRSALRCLLYGLCFGFLPFAVFGGLHVTDMIRFFLGYSEKVSMSLSDRVNFTAGFTMLARCLRIPLSAGGVKVLMLLVSFLSLGGAVLQKGWKSAALLAILCIGFPSFGYVYGLVFLIPPLMLFLREGSARNAWNWIYCALFLLIFAPYPWYKTVSVGVSSTLVIRNAALIIFALVLTADGVYRTVRRLLRCAEEKKAVTV